MMRNGSWFWLGPCLILMVACMVMMMRMMGHGSHRTHGAHGAPLGDPGDRRGGDAERILTDRLTRGDIDIEQYERRRETPQATRERDGG